MTKHEQEPHIPTDAQRELVKKLSGIGVPQKDICVIIGISKPTLHKYYRHELDLGLAEVNAKVATYLFKHVEAGNLGATIFWLKARAGWREKHDVEVEHSGKLLVGWTNVGARPDVKDRGRDDDDSDD